VGVKLSRWCDQTTINELSPALQCLTIGAFDAVFTALKSTQKQRDLDEKQDGYKTVNRVAFGFCHFTYACSACFGSLYVLWK